MKTNYTMRYQYQSRVKNFPKKFFYMHICVYFICAWRERHEMFGKNTKLECSQRSILICNVTETKENNFKMGAEKQNNRDGTWEGKYTEGAKGVQP